MIPSYTIKRMGEELITCRNYNYINLCEKKLTVPVFSAVTVRDGNAFILLIIIMLF